jgi:FMN-dependent NADH-azoreductase
MPNPLKLLEIQSSVRLEKSISRALSREFTEIWHKFHPDATHKQRDVGIEPPPHPTELWTMANYLPPASRTPAMESVLEVSEGLIEELLWADRLVLGVPMYNFSVPSTLKAYLDNIVRIDRTFSFDPQTHTFEGLTIGISRKLVII